MSIPFLLTLIMATNQVVDMLQVAVCTLCVIINVYVVVYTSETTFLDGQSLLSKNGHICVNAHYVYLNHLATKSQ